MLTSFISQRPATLPLHFAAQKSKLQQLKEQGMERAVELERDAKKAKDPKVAQELRDMAQRYRDGVTRIEDKQTHDHS